MTKAALALGVDRLTGWQHAALKLALWEGWLAFGRDEAKISRLLDRWKLRKFYSFYVSRRELYDGA